MISVYRVLGPADPLRPAYGHCAACHERTRRWPLVIATIGGTMQLRLCLHHWRELTRAVENSEHGPTPLPPRT